jgi:hypothetical protein
MFVSCTIVGFLAVLNATGQEIEPRAYSPAPLGTTFVVAGFGRAQGPILVDPSLDIHDFNDDVWLLTAGGGRVFGVAGHQARVFALFPMAVGSVSGDVQPQVFSQTLKGLVDPRFKVTLGLLGAPATKTVVTQRSLVVGTTLTVSTPLGQYDPTHLVNVSRHRWAFKPEVGVSHVVGRWTLGAQSGVWLYTTNDQYYPGHARQSQDPIVTIQTNVTYALTRRSWWALGGTLFSGGQTRIDGVESPNLQRNSRIGATLSLPIAANQSVQLIYGTGITTRRGWDFSSLVVTWQFVTF